ncbi:TetR/AcrR family transcriptional regulator [Glutamicibacter arilaitensis]|uniref:TetR family transcriptional regulator n=1 Tax=Glutamicibacter arilaitensis TaxID=256701 RepID=A0A4Y8U1G9_9MICC|nr:TetR/AcrR family transcriptional regulator C-terminal domain-containing protein [Glutamicibacter arilaitensis]TFH57534.1 TetR family transcriptional regulator [Glutamicibacter arilaitensis]
MSENKETSTFEPVKRGRGRPRKDSEFVSLSKELIAQKALEIAGAEGYDALTMHRLAAEFKATPRALYNYVTDRQEVINLAVERFLSINPLIEFDCTDWERGVREAYNATRNAYRAYPRASQMTIDEKLVIKPGPMRNRLIERILQFYVDIGLELKQAVALVRALERDVLGFVMHVDYYYDRRSANAPNYISSPVPVQQLEAYPAVPTPLARQALELPQQDSDELFEEVIELRLLAIERMREINGVAGQEQE